MDTPPDVKVWVDGKETMRKAVFVKKAQAAVARGRRVAPQNIRDVEPEPWDGYYFVRIHGESAFIAMREEQS